MSKRPTCALVLLCFVQGCERFAFFALLPLLVLYLHHRHGFSEPTALLLLGVLNALSYFSGLPGGILIDRKLGPAVSLIVGAGLLTAGYGVLATDHRALLWLAFGLLVCGHGMFRPAMAIQLGAVFPSNDVRREHGFLWQYLAINVACIVGPLCAEAVTMEHRWRNLFLLVSASMLVGTLVLICGVRRLSSVARQSARDPNELSPSKNSATRWKAVWLPCALAVVFWLTALQAGGSLVLFAEEHTVRSFSAWGHSIAIGPSQFTSLHGLLVLLLMPPFVSVSTRLRRRRILPSTPVKLLWGYIATAAAFILVAAARPTEGEATRVSPAWLLGCYLLLSIAELFLGPFGMSIVTQIAPPSRAGQAVGLWFTSAAAGNVAAGALGLLWDHWSNHRYFALLALVSLGAAAVMLMRASWLERLLSTSEGQTTGGQP